MTEPAEAVLEANRLFRKDLFESLRWLGMSKDDAQDVCQDVFLRYFEYLSDGRVVDNPRAWLMTAAKHRAFDFFDSADQRLTVRGDFWEGFNSDAADNRSGAFGVGAPKAARRERARDKAALEQDRARALGEASVRDDAEVPVTEYPYVAPRRPPVPMTVERKDVASADRSGSSPMLFGIHVYAQQCVDEMLRNFGVRYPEQAIAVLAQFDGESTEEISKRLGRSPAATRTFLSDARRKLKEYLADCEQYLEEESNK
jgi:RNA polymerase sigma factor (sigma-70 family)